MADKEDPKVDVKLKDLVEKDRTDRITECEAEIQAVLKKHNCNLSTLQEWLNGQPGKVMIRVLSNI